MRSPSALLSLLLVWTAGALATPTEHHALRVLPAPGPVVVDGRDADWDRSGGVFICDDVETQRDRFAVWLHAMYDADCLYLLAHFTDPTPLNNPGQTMADYGFAGDCLQFRAIVAPGTPRERCSHWTCWRGADQRDVMDVTYGRKFDQGGLKDAKTAGARQAFAVDADGRGYVQELAIPWTVLAKEGWQPTAGATLAFTCEPNFTIGTKGRLTIKDLFKEGVTPDRVFTFMANDKWGSATLEAAGHVAPRPVRVAGGQLFPVSFADGRLTIDWSGLAQPKTRPGFKPVRFTLPADGYASLNLTAPDGTVACQLLNGEKLAQGAHEVLWDGLTTANLGQPGQPVAPGDYRASVVFHRGLGLKLRGWAANGGEAPWDNGPRTNWGGDHGQPRCAAADATHVYLGWDGAEAGKAVLACDPAGHVLWSNNRGGIAGVKGLAADGGVLYVLGGTSGVAAEGGAIYKLRASDGTYVAWGGGQEADLSVKGLFDGAPERAAAIAAYAGRIYLACRGARFNGLAVLDGASGKLLEQWPTEPPTAVAAGPRGVFVLAGESLFAVAAGGQPKLVRGGLTGAAALALGGERCYVALRDPDNQVLVLDATGATAAKLGRPGGRPLLGRWDPSGMRFAAGVAVGPDGRVWVAEQDGSPKRVSCWNPDGTLAREFFGPSGYGALGGAINPRDPDLMLGQGCEWRLDPATGQARCLAVITRDGCENARFGEAPGGRQYVLCATGWIHGNPPVNVYERVGDADWRLRGRFTYAGKDKTATTSYWADADGDGVEQPAEVQTVPGTLRFSGWYMSVTADLTIYTGRRRLRLQGLTAAGAPRWELSATEPLPGGPTGAGMGAMDGLGSADGQVVLYNGAYGVDRTWLRAWDVAGGRQLWTYPDNFVGVHGSHNACPPAPGLVRGAYDVVGSATLPGPVGGVFVIPTNVGEWHLLTQDGFYLGRLFQPDPLKVRWPASAAPGTVADDLPPGMGGEDFGGSIALARDGQLYVQAGKTAYWNLVVTGLDTVQRLGAGTVTIGPDDVPRAQEAHDAQLQALAGPKKLGVARLTPTFTGRLDADFRGAGDGGAEFVRYAKSDDSAVRAVAAWDDDALYVGWEVKDATPWVNAAGEPEQMYLSGDTVDLQLGAQPAHDNPAAGDLRLSIGPCAGVPTAVLYRPVSAVNQPRVFSSGVVKEYRVDWVGVLPEVVLKVTRQPGQGYVVEARVPWPTLGFKPAAGLQLRGDLGATHGDPAGRRTRLRSYWSNQHTGIVDDAVFELKPEPRHWGEWVLK